MQIGDIPSVLQAIAVTLDLLGIGVPQDEREARALIVYAQAHTGSCFYPTGLQLCAEDFSLNVSGNGNIKLSDGKKHPCAIHFEYSHRSMISDYLLRCPDAGPELITDDVKIDADSSAIRYAVRWMRAHPLEANSAEK